MQRTITLFFVLIMSTLLNASNSWAPVVMQDITTFVLYKASTQPPVAEPDNSILLSSGNAQSGVADRGMYSYYKIYAHAGERIHIDLYNQDANGNLYVKVGSKASKENYDCKSENGGETHSKENDSCSLLVDRDSFVYIAVHAPTYGCYSNVQHTVMAYKGDYGVKGPYRIGQLDSNGLRLFYPITIKKKPLVIFLSGYTPKTISDIDKYDGNTEYKPTNKEKTNYTELSKFIASHGYSVILRPNLGNPWKPDFGGLKKIIKLYKDKLDTSKIGIVGFSHGGGIAFELMKELNVLEYGKNGRFMMPIEPMYAIGMYKQDMNQLKLNKMNFVMMRFGSKGQDPQTNFVEYKLLDGQEVEKNYINLGDEHRERQDHKYLFDMEKPFLKPLDALMAFTFKGDVDAKDIALEGPGKDNPKAVEKREDDPKYYDDKCIVYNGIDYCAEVQF